MPLPSMTQPFEIIDDQPNFIVVNKPENINFHDEGELGHGFFNQVKHWLSKNNAASELYPVHRLDKMTSGLLIFAKSNDSAQAFQQLFQQHNVQKYYLALSDKKPNKKQGLIKGDMVKSRRSTWKLLRSQHNPAISQFMSYNVGSGCRLYVVKPHSGKTHQIRVALNSIGAPIMGDVLYTPNALQPALVDRGYLHAYALQFTLNHVLYEYIKVPNSGEYFLSPELNQQLTNIGKPWLLPWPKV